MSASNFVINPPPALAPAALVDAFRQVVTPHISDNLNRLSGIVGLQRFHRSSKLVGTAFTVKARPGDNLLVYKALMLMSPGHVLVDGNRLPRWSYPATAIVSGDAHSLSIAAASILAKETRDAIMLEHAAVHPHYHWHSNKGYGCKHHLAALLEHGPTPIHRRSFAPVAAAYARITPDAAAGPLFTASAANQFHG